jgi:hypothetical protein
MSLISKETATDIALAYRELEAAEKLLTDVREASENFRHKDIRDAFGRVQHGLQLGVPSGDNSTRLFNVPYPLAIPVIETHIAHHKAKLAALSEKARQELSLPDAERTGGGE